MLQITSRVGIPDEEIEIRGVQAAGPGGQNVNKVASAAQLFFRIRGSSLPLFCQERLLRESHRWVTEEGWVVIKAKSHRTFERNRQEALRRLRMLILNALRPEKMRKPTRPSRAAIERRLSEKQRQSEKKARRRPPETH